MRHDPRANEVTRGGVRQPYIDSATVASIQTVFNRSRLSHQSWRSRQMEGRLDSRHVWRNDARDVVDIFKERTAPSVTKVNVWLLVDASSSMLGPNSCRAQDVTATLVDAFKRIPTVKLHVWQHSATNSMTKLFRNYEPGMHPTEGISKQLLNIAGGNSDGFALAALGERALKLARRDEKVIIIVISDGQPSVHGRGATNHDIQAHTVEVSEDLRNKGVTVLSVAIAGTGGFNVRMYGKDNVIPFDQSSPTRWPDLARSFSAIIGRKLQRQGTR